jgi:Protein of unknown function (DUF4232)
MSAHVPALPLEADPLIAEAKQRARRRRLIAATALLALGLIVGGVFVFSSSGGGGSGEVPWLRARPQLVPANPPLAPACKASQLGATLGLQGATQNLAGSVEIRNRSSSPCSLVGRPKLSFAGATSKWRETRGQSGFFPPDPLAPPRSSLRALAPGGWASVGLWWSGWCGRGSNDGGNSGAPPTALLLTAPGGGTIRMAQNGIGGGSRPLGAPPCNGQGASTLSATRFTPVIPQGTVRSELPLRARMVSEAKIPFKGEQPGFVAQPGAWLSYTVVLTNRGHRPFTFGRSCPVYTEQWGLAPAQAFVLNCRPVGSIGPGRSVRFAMRIQVPPHVRTPSEAFDWILAPHTWNAPQASGYAQLR